MWFETKVSKQASEIKNTKSYFNLLNRDAIEN